MKDKPFKREWRQIHGARNRNILRARYSKRACRLRRRHHEYKSPRCFAAFGSSRSADRYSQSRAASVSLLAHTCCRHESAARYACKQSSVFALRLGLIQYPHADCVGTTMNISPRAASLPSVAPAALTGIRNPAPLPCRFLLIPVVVMKAQPDMPASSHPSSLYDWDLYSKYRKEIKT